MGILTEVNAEQLANAKDSIEVTESGILTEVKAEQWLNAKLPIETTELGILTEDKEEQDRHCNQYGCKCTLRLFIGTILIK